jgi:hypothetical protein
VHGIGESRSASRRAAGDQHALRREAEHLILEQFQLGVLEKFFRVVAFGQLLDRPAQPGVGVGFGDAGAPHRCRWPESL